MPRTHGNPNNHRGRSKLSLGVGRPLPTSRSVSRTVVKEREGRKKRNRQARAYEFPRAKRGRHGRGGGGGRPAATPNVIVNILTTPEGGHVRVADAQAPIQIRPPLPPAPSQPLIQHNLGVHPTLHGVPRHPIGGVTPTPGARFRVPVEEFIPPLAEDAAPATPYRMTPGPRPFRGSRTDATTMPYGLTPHPPSTSPPPGNPRYLPTEEDRTTARKKALLRQAIDHQRAINDRHRSALRPSRGRMFGEARGSEETKGDALGEEMAPGPTPFETRNVASGNMEARQEFMVGQTQTPLASTVVQTTARMNDIRDARFRVSSNFETQPVAFRALSDAQRNDALQEVDVNEPFNIQGRTTDNITQNNGPGPT